MANGIVNVSEFKGSRFARLFRRILAGFATAAAAGLSMVYVFASDSTTFGEYIAIWPAGFWLIGLIPPLLLSFDFGKRGGRPFAIGAISVAAFVAATTEWGPLLRMALPGSRPDGETIRIVSWNINDAPGGKAGILERLAALEPDLCFLQETPDGALSFLEEDLAGVWEGFHWADAGDCGVLSRYPIETLESGKVGPWTAPQALSVELPDGAALTCVNVRLMLPSLVVNPLPERNRERLAADHAARILQYEKLAEEIDRVAKRAGTTNVILAGDFNTPGGRRSLKPLRKRLRDAWRAAGIGWGATMMEGFPVSRIDQCWVGGEIEPVRATVRSGAPSDHRMLVVDVAVPAPSL